MGKTHLCLFVMKRFQHQLWTSLPTISKTLSTCTFVSSTQISGTIIFQLIPEMQPWMTITKSMSRSTSISVLQIKDGSAYSFHSTSGTTDFLRSSIKRRVCQCMRKWLKRNLHPRMMMQKLKTIISKSINLLKYTSQGQLWPPENPCSYYRFKKDQECSYCDEIGKDFDNTCHGGYLTAIVGFYHNENKEE